MNYDPQAAQARKDRIEAETRERHRVYQRERLVTDLGDRYAACSLDNFELYDDGQCAVVESIRRICESIDSAVEGGCGLVLFGPPGTGKDHLLTVAMFAAIDAGLSVERSTRRRSASAIVRAGGESGGFSLSTGVGSCVAHRVRPRLRADVERRPSAA